MRTLMRPSADILRHLEVALEDLENGNATPTADETNVTDIRQSTHGDFRTNAEVSQAIKNILDTRSESYTDIQSEALDMIALKLSRIASGQASHDDHWVDIIGYATLALKEIRGE